MRSWTELSQSLRVFLPTVGKNGDRTVKTLHDRTWDSSPGLPGGRQTLYHVAIKVGLYRKAVQV